MNYLNSYVNFLRPFLKPKSSLKVVLDCSNGSAGLVLKRLFEDTKIKVLLINSRPDGRFLSHSPNPLDKGAKTALIKKVRKAKAELGVIFDGDGDRALFLDSRGKEIPTDVIARLLITYLQPKKVVINTTTGFMVRDKKGLNKFHIFNSPVGGYFLKKIMKRNKVQFGAEHSGHYYFKDFYYCDSGILATIFVLNTVSLLKSRGLSLGEWLDSLPKYYSIGERNLRIKNSHAFIGRLKKVLSSERGLSFSDGITLRQKDFWLNVRPSRTQSLIRINMEARNKGPLSKELAKLNRLLKELEKKTTIHK